MALQHYCPLDPKSREIRLLSLEPGSSTDDIHIWLHYHCLSTIPPPNYEALSYVWGSSQHHNPIQIRKQNGQTQQILVTQNLFIALAQLRHERNTRDLWVDAICIDQSNVIERSQQVAMMGDIYRCATRVIASLGLEGNDSTYALQFMSKLSSQVTVNWVTQEIEFSATCKTLSSLRETQILLTSRRECEAIYHVLMRPWFERLWIVQEIAIGKKNAILLCGEDSIPWMNFLDAFFCIYFRVSPTVFGDIYEPFRARGYLIYQLAMMQISGTLEDCRLLLGQSKCSDPRDKIYGILNVVSHEDQKIGIYPDYSKSVAEVFQNTASRWIKHYRALHILQSCQMTPSPADTPSWVPDWSTPLTFEPIWRPIENNGWDDDLVLFSFPSSRTLRLFGVACATIKGRCDLTGLRWGMNPQASYDNLTKIISFGLEAAQGEGYKTGGTMEEAICRTLLVNYFSGSFYPPKMSISGFQDCLRVLKESGQDVVSDVAQYYLRDFMLFSQGRCFVTTEEGYIGMAGSPAQKADIVCDILGCDKPLLLRPMAKGPNICYQLVSDCYIQGLMGHDAIFGELPANYQEIFYYDEDKKENMIGYLNHVSEEIEKEDPRPRRQEVKRIKLSLCKTTDISELEEERGLSIWRDSGANITPFDVI